MENQKEIPPPPGGGSWTWDGEDWIPNVKATDQPDQPAVDAVDADAFTSLNHQE